MCVGGKGERINPVASNTSSLNLQVEEDFVFVYLSLDLWSQTKVTPGERTITTIQYIFLYIRKQRKFLVEENKLAYPRHVTAKLESGVF